MKEGKKSLVCSVRNALTTSDSIDSGPWTFRDGVPVHEELKDLELVKIHAVCARQSWSQWTSIATRERLYQFMAMSGEDSVAAARLIQGWFCRVDPSPILVQPHGTNLFSHFNSGSVHHFRPVLY